MVYLAAAILAVSRTMSKLGATGYPDIMTKSEQMRCFIANQGFDRACKTTLSNNLFGSLSPAKLVRWKINPFHTRITDPK